MTTKIDHLHPAAAYVRLSWGAVDSEAAYYPIVLRFATHVVICVSYQDAIPIEGRLLPIPGQTLHFDRDGDGLAVVPVERILGVIDEAEMAAIEECLDADDRLLSYAR